MKSLSLATQKTASRIFFIFLVIILSILYLAHPSQDLGDPVSHDEASYHLSAKDIVRFGPASLNGDRLTYISFPLDALLGIISFFIFGVSLFSMRLPYIILNILGNLAFFDLIRKERGGYTAFIITLAFAFFTPRYLIGKGAMVESLILPLVLFTLWLLDYTKRNGRAYLGLGILGMLVFMEKMDNIFIPIFLTALVAVRCLRLLRKKQILEAKTIIIRYLLGINIVIIAWLLFYTLAGWDKASFQIRYILEGNLNKAAWISHSGIPPFSAELFLRNLVVFSLGYPGMFAVLVLLGLPFMFVAIFSRKERFSSLSMAIYLTGFLLLGKFMISTIFVPRRITTCLPLAYLIIASIAGLVVLINTKHKILTGLKYTLVSLVIGFFVFVSYLPKAGKESLELLLKPQYAVLREARQIAKLIERKPKVLILDGRFGYIALQLPNKCSEMPPDLLAPDFYLMESNPGLLRKRLVDDTSIAYVFCRGDNPIVRKILEQDFGARLILNNVTSTEGVLYAINR